MDGAAQPDVLWEPGAGWLLSLVCGTCSCLVMSLPMMASASSSRVLIALTHYIPAAQMLFCLLCLSKQMTGFHTITSSHGQILPGGRMEAEQALLGLVILNYVSEHVSKTWLLTLPSSLLLKSHVFLFSPAHWGCEDEAGKWGTA